MLLVPLPTMSKRKIVNDPIYGLISFPFDLLYDLIDHPYFQRLRRISQMGLSTYVYPGATHSRFSHALGALHLMTVSINVLRDKDIQISDDEYLAVCIAILLHDIGHGPYSHALESNIVNKHHEMISLDIMKQLNEEFEGKLSLGITIFQGQYEKKFLTQLVSSQLDMDRMDYLTRDSYFSGVAEGVIGYKRIISMINVVDNELVIEEKGLFSIEKFLVARHIMYWQVYLHKTSISAEQMLKNFVIRYRELLKEGVLPYEDSTFGKVLFEYEDFPSNSMKYLDSFIKLDDADVMQSIKLALDAADPILTIFAKGILNRILFGVRLSNMPYSSDFKDEIRHKIEESYNIKNPTVIDRLILEGKESTTAYDNIKEEIKILSKNGDIKPISAYLDILVNVNKITKYYLCYPK